MPTSTTIQETQEYCPLNINISKRDWGYIILALSVVTGGGFVAFMEDGKYDCSAVPPVVLQASFKYCTDAGERLSVEECRDAVQRRYCKK